jgi:hypothetical protein
MNELHKYYSKRLLQLLFVVLTATLLLGSLHTTLVKDHASKLAVDASALLAQHAVVAALLLLGEMTIRKWLWRIEKPSLDFSGRWSGSTTYTTSWLDNDSRELPGTTRHDLDIKQDCLSVAVMPTTSQAFAQWHSLICDLPQDGGISYTYEVSYKHRKSLPSKARGYEVLNVVDKDTQGRPQHIAGEFHHLVSSDKPVFSGLAEFTRTPKSRAAGTRRWRPRRRTR